jgi:FKBP-type peptidyl-prolyl cis-trans isomerase SlyD
MVVAADKVVLIHYTLKNDEGKVIDSSAGGDPLAYIHGHGNLIPGLERELEGKPTGERLSVKIAPTDGYGERNPSLLQRVPKRSFGGSAVKPGMQFQAQTSSGEARIATVTGVQGDMVMVDMNHPLAGENLHFEVEITEIRDATEEELAHGHVHGPGGHHHH